MCASLRRKMVSASACGCISPDAKFEHEDHSLDIREYTITGKDVLLLSGKDAEVNGEEAPIGRHPTTQRI